MPPLLRWFCMICRYAALGAALAGSAAAQTYPSGPIRMIAASFRLRL